MNSKEPTFVRIAENGTEKMVTFYEFLSADEKASEEDLKKAYLRKCMEFHPDKNPGDTAKEKCFKALQILWPHLKTPAMRDAYDYRLALARGIIKPKVSDFGIKINFSYGWNQTGGTTSTGGYYGM